MLIAKMIELGLAIVGVVLLIVFREQIPTLLQILGVGVVLFRVLSSS